MSKPLATKLSTPISDVQIGPKVSIFCVATVIIYYKHSIVIDSNIHVEVLY